jgi:quinol monooxygenase YgiN
MSINVLVLFRVKETKVGTFRELMSSVKTSLSQVPGCRGVRIFHGVDEPKLFTLLETWESKERHRAHFAMLVAAGQWAQLLEYLAADPVTSYLEEL